MSAFVIHKHIMNRLEYVNKRYRYRGMPIGCELSQRVCTVTTMEEVLVVSEL